MNNSDLPNKPTVPDLLRDGAHTYSLRNAAYGNNYKTFGPIMMQMFPDGLPVLDADGWNRFGVWMMLLNKVVRYAPSLQAGGHADTAHDIMVYGAMLEELTEGEL